MILDAPADLSGCTVFYGGSFDPPHLGHQMACLYMLEALGATSVWLVPSASHPHQKNLAPFAHRLAMCGLLAQMFGPRVTICDMEQRLAAPNYTYETLRALAAAYPDKRWVLAIGADLLPQLPAWHRAESLLAQVDILVLGRTGFAQRDATPALPNFSSSDVRTRLREKRSIFGLVPHVVADYILAQKLYCD